jgi:hypothetical protein
MVVQVAAGQVVQLVMVLAVVPMVAPVVVPTVQQMLLVMVPEVQFE